MRRTLLLLPLLLAACGGSPSRTDDRSQPDPEPETTEPVWREDQKPAEPKQPTKPAEPKPADPKVEKQPTKPAEPAKPADPKVEKQPTKPAEPAKPAEPKQPTKPADPVKPADPKVEKQPTKPAEPLQPKPDEMDVLADEFIADVKSRLSGLEATKSWKQFQNDYKHYKDKLQKALDEKKKDKPNPKGLEKAWAECIKAWFEARYSLLRFLHLHTPDKNFQGTFIHDRDDVKRLSKAELRSADCRASQAATEVSAEAAKDLGRFQGDYVKNDLVCNNVYLSKDHEKTWSDEKKKWSDAADGKFDSKDLQRFKD